MISNRAVRDALSVGMVPLGPDKAARIAAARSTSLFSVIVVSWALEMCGHEGGQLLK